MAIRIITTQSDLEIFCSEISTAPCIAVDTEFMRERTYYAKLCLVQVASENAQALIDPIAGSDMDLAPLMAIFNNPNILKIMHSPEQDIEIFYTMAGVIPTPLFDSQIAAMALGLGDTIAYHNLVQSQLGITLDKSQQYTDWLRRPMSDAQLSYALADVTHLLTMYPMLKRLLDDKNRSEWIADATRALMDPERYTPKPESCYKRVRHQLKRPEQMAVLQALCAWREERAMQKNLPRGHVLKDEVVAEIARHLPRDAETLKSLRLLKPIKDDTTANILVSIIERVLLADSATYPARGEKPDTMLNNELVGLLSLLLKQRCRKSNVASRLIATRSDLEDVALGKTDIACMQGWRDEVFGKHARDLMAGKLSFHWDSTAHQVAMDESES
jgi:ribonuclease D